MGVREVTWAVREGVRDELVPAVAGRELGPDFVEALKELECQEACQGLAMHSFLMLPMQRITRLPLLTDAIASRYSLLLTPVHSVTVPSSGYPPPVQSSV